MLHRLQTLAERRQPLRDGLEHLLLAHQEALLLEPFLETRFLKALERLLQPREGGEPLRDLPQLAPHIQDAAAALLQIPLEIAPAPRRCSVGFDETVQQAGQLLPALGQLRDLVLSVHLDAREHVARRHFRDLAALVLHDRWIRQCALDRVLARRRPMHPHAE